MIPLPWQFITYLNEDGIFLGADNKAFVQYKNEESSSEDERWQKTTEQDEEEQGIEFPELAEQIQEVIREYENVFPKLNTSAPVDASWMNWNGKNKCSHPDQVFLLLKSSDIVSDMISLPDASSECAYKLVLKKFYNLQESSEFRCIVQGNVLKGKSQPV